MPRAKIPVEIQDLRGNPGKRRLDGTEPEPKIHVPDTLTDAGWLAWRPELANIPRAGGDFAVAFINGLTHTKGSWAQHGFGLRPWQEAQIIRPLFGELIGGVRRYRTCYIEIPRKNGKTEIAAAIALYLLLGDGEIGAEVYSAACDRDQASLAFNVASAMVNNDPKLKDIIEVIPSRRRMVHHASGSFYAAIPSNEGSAHGYNAHGIICDELHAWPNRGLWDVLTTSVGSRRQPLTFVITTAGFDRNSICWEVHQDAERVREDPSTDPTFLPVLYGAPESADWLSEDVWKAANPALGDFRFMDEMRASANKAQVIPARQNVFRRLYLCQWTESETRWLDMAAWDQCAGDLNVSALEGRTCYGALDLSTTTDLSTLVLVFPAEDGFMDVLPLFWCPEEGLRQRANRDRVPYDEWARRGLLIPTPGNVVDYDQIRETVLDLTKRYRLAEIGYDRWNSSQLVTQLIDDGATMIPIGQGFASMAAPARELEKLVLSRKLRHGGHPILRWCAANVVVEQDAAGNLKPSKKKSTERIDGIVALMMAIDRASRNEGGPSVYEQRGILSM